MDLNSLTGHTKHSINSDYILKTQLLWMLLLRIVLYTLLLGISFILQRKQFDVIVLPSNVLIPLLLIIYLITVFSAIVLPVFLGNLRNFAFFQHLLAVRSK